VTAIKLTEGEVTIELPGLTAVRIDTARRLIAVDGISGSEMVAPEWSIADLRDGTYGGFHRLLPAGECIDVDCIESGQHAITATWHAAWHADWDIKSRDDAGNAILLHKPTGGSYRLVPVED
jgi:hypothetical protein